ncbi:MAG: esterase-like activity of phytase family protein, partial [Mycobacteriales bacterium]
SAPASRLLTGADFDIESVQRGADGTLWFGDEFGPFLLHTSAGGALLEPPIELAGIRAPEDPHLPLGASPSLGSSRGFEALGADATGTMLYPILERATNAELDPLRRLIYEFDTRSSQYTGRTWQYRADADGNSVSDVQRLADGRFAVLERDALQGAEAKDKRIYAIDFDVVDSAGFVAKHQLADLLTIANPAGIGNESPAGGFGLGDPFSMPFPTVEALLILDEKRILIAQDNNYPDNDVRVSGVPDATEMIVIDAQPS